MKEQDKKYTDFKKKKWRQATYLKKIQSDDSKR